MRNFWWQSRFGTVLSPRTLRSSCVSILPPGLQTQYFVHLQSTLNNSNKRQLRYQKHFSFFQHIQNDLPFFMFCCQYISIHLCNKNQLDAPFILSLFHQLTSTRFGHIWSPWSGSILYIHNKLVRVVRFSWLLAGQEAVTWKAQSVTICCTYIYVYIYIYYISWW
jgi:hypothetical protein